MTVRSVKYPDSATLAALNAHALLTTGTHGVTGTFVGTTDIQSLSNKTLTATPSIAFDTSGTGSVARSIYGSATKLLFRGGSSGFTFRNTGDTADVFVLTNAGAATIGEQDVLSTHTFYGQILQYSNALFQNFMRCYTNTQAHSAYFNIQKASGTRAAPGEVSAGDNLGYIVFGGWKGDAGGLSPAFRTAFSVTSDVTSVGVNFVNATTKFYVANDGSQIQAAAIASTGAWTWHQSGSSSDAIFHTLNGNCVFGLGAATTLAQTITRVFGSKDQHIEFISATTTNLQFQMKVAGWRDTVSTHQHTSANYAMMDVQMAGGTASTSRAFAVRSSGTTAASPYVHSAGSAAVLADILVLTHGGALTVGPAVTAGVNGVAHVVNTGDQGNTFDGRVGGTLKFCNNAVSYMAPSICGTTTDTNAATRGLHLAAATVDNTSAEADMSFEVRENDDTDFSGTYNTIKAYSFRRYSTELLSITRAGQMVQSGAQSISSKAITLADDATYTGCSGRGMLIVTDVTSTGNSWIFAMGNATVTLMGDPSGGGAVADTDNKLCLYYSGGQFVLKNRLGTSITFNCMYISGTTTYYLT